MKIGFILFAFILILSLNSYVIIRGYQALVTLPSVRTFYLTTMIICFLALIISMIWGAALPLLASKAISFIGFTYLIFSIYLMFSFVWVDFFRVANYFIHFFPSGTATLRLWAMAGSVVVIVIAMIIGNYKFNHPEIVKLNLVTSKPIQHKELKIVAASDLHLGISIDKKRLQSFVQLINDQHPDLVLLVGDVTDRWVEPIVRQNMAEELQKIKAPLGVFAINGNHEHYAEQPDATAKYLTSAGVKVLRDEAFLVDNSFYVVGRGDRTNLRRKKLADLVSGLDTSKPIIMMDHQPFHLSEAEENHIDLQLSGHTHDGQFFPGNLIVKRMYEQGHGYLKKGNTHYYISSGLGIWGPHYRIGTQSELVVINLKI